MSVEQVWIRRLLVLIDLIDPTIIDRDYTVIYTKAVENTAH
jgi:hypothetical protein